MSSPEEKERRIRSLKMKKERDRRKIIKTSRPKEEYHREEHKLNIRTIELENDLHDDTRET